jgi:hypothetical protein
MVMIISIVTSVSTVGSKKVPPSADCFPPVMTLWVTVTVYKIGCGPLIL